MTAKFTDSVHDDFELCQELLRGMPGTAQQRAKKAATQFIEVWDKLKAEAPKDPAVAVGAAFAVFFVANHIINATDSAISDKLIKTVGNA